MRVKTPRVTDHRRLKSIAQRYDVEISRQANPLRILRRKTCYVVMLLSVLICLPFLMGDQRSLESRPVSRSHQVFEQNCKACHDQRFAPLHRLVTLNNNVHSVSEEACQKCHAESTMDHVDHSLVTTSLLQELEGSDKQDLEALFAKMGCVECHQEHLGRTLIETVRDEHCSECHKRIGTTTEQTQFALDFHNFDHHPELAMYREPPRIEDRHRSLRLTKIVNGERKDVSAIRFNHRRHLDPELPNAQRQVKALDCQSCHQLDSNGAYFQPISFAKHCQECHQLGFRETGVLPHESPDIIRGILLDRLSRTDPPAPDGADSIGGPTKPVSRDQLEAKNQLAALKDRLTKLEERLFNSPKAGPRVSNAKALLETACSKCHFTEAANSDSTATQWRVVPPRIPGRWLPHSVFRHDSHDSMACAQCHSNGGVALESAERTQFYPEEPDRPTDSLSIFTSKSAQDILLPSMQVCQQCHGTRRNAQQTAGISADCTTCHTYHHAQIPQNNSSKLLEFLGHASGNQ